MVRSTFSPISLTQQTLCRLTDVQGVANMLFITRSLLAGKGRPIRFHRQGQRKRAKDALAAVLASSVADSDSRSLRSSPLLPHQQCLLIQVMFRPWMLLARGPRRSEQRNPVGEEGVCCQGQHASYALSLPSSTEAMALIVQHGPTASSLLSRQSRCNFEPP